MDKKGWITTSQQAGYQRFDARFVIRVAIPIEVSQVSILEFGVVGRHCYLRTTRLASEAASEIVSEES